MIPSQTFNPLTAGNWAGQPPTQHAFPQIPRLAILDILKKSEGWNLSKNVGALNVGFDVFAVIGLDPTEHLYLYSELTVEAPWSNFFLH